MNILLRELKKFSKENWWIYIVFSISLLFIFYTNTGNIFEVSIVVLFHMFGDILVMMFGTYYALKEYEKGGIAQLLSTFIFTGIGIYGVINSNEWQYLLSNFVFSIVAIKSYLVYVKNINLNYMNAYLAIFLNVIVYIIYYYFDLLATDYAFIQSIGFAIFSIALILNNDKKKYFLSLIGLFTITIGSAIGFYANYLNGEIYGTTLSTILLPLTVVVFYLKNFKKYL